MRTLFFFTILFFVEYGYGIQRNSVLHDTGNLTFELTKEKIIIPVQISGKTYRFLVDTGGVFEISEALQNKFNFNQKAATTIVDINRNEIDIKTVVVPEIKLGNWSFKNRKAIVSDLHHKYPYSCFELDGMIGRDFFVDVILHFDYASNTFRLSENIEAIETDIYNKTKLKLSRRGLPNIKLKINGKSKYIEFDSGSGDFYSPKTSDVENRLNTAPDGDILKFSGEFSFGVTMDNIQNTNRYLEKMESFQIANTTFTNFYSQFSKVSAPRIGAEILKYGKVTLDYKNGWFYYQSYSKNQVLRPYESFGFDIAIENGYYKVKYILEGSDADKLGLRPGYKIIKINNVATQNISNDCDGYLYGYAFKNSENINVTFLNDKRKEKTIALSLKTYN